jgi:NIPSNAP
MRMIYELRTYTLKPNTAPEAARNAGTIGRDIRGDNFGKLEGYWITEIGPLNQVMHLWSYPDLNERAKVRAALSANKRWTTEYVPLIRDKLIRQDIRLLHGIIAPTKPAKDGNIYEFRNYRIKATAVGQWVGHFREALPVRETYSKITALFQTEAGQPNEVCHIWAYPDLIERSKARGAAVADKDWQAFLGKGGPLIEEMHSTIMLPAAHSPLK